MKNLQVTTIGKIGKQTINNLLKEVDMDAVLNEEEQTIIKPMAIYEFNHFKGDKGIAIRKYTYKEYATKYGESTLEDLKERLY